MNNLDNSRNAFWFNQLSAGCKNGYSLMNAFLLILFVISQSSCSTTNEKPLVIREQGSFAAGGTVIADLLSDWLKEKDLD